MQTVNRFWTRLRYRPNIDSRDGIRLHSLLYHQLLDQNYIRDTTMDTYDDIRIFGPDIEGHGDSYYLLYAIDKNIENLAAAFRVLPPIQEDGSSEAPQAEAAYFRKEEQVVFLNQKLQLARSYVQQQRDQAERFERKHGEIAFRGDVLNGQKRPDDYSGYDRDLIRQYEGMQSFLSRLQEAIQKGEKALRAAETKKFPRVPMSDFGRRPGEPLPSTSELLDNSKHVNDLLRRG